MIILSDAAYGDKPSRSLKQSNYRRIARLFAPYLKAQSLALACVLVSAALGLLPGILTALIIDRAIPQHDMRELLLYVGGMIAVALTSLGLGVVSTWYNSIVGEGIVRDVRTKLVTHLHHVPLAFFSATKSGEVMTRVSSDVDELRTVVSATLPMMVSNVAMIVSTIVAMFVWNWRLACIAVLILPLMIAPISPMGRKIYAISKMAREQRDLVESLVQETLSVSGITLVKSFTREAYEGSRFLDWGTRLMHLEIRLATIGRWFSAAVGAMVILGPALIWTGGGWLAIRGALDVGVIVAFIGYIQGRLYAPASMVFSMQAQIIGALAIFDRIFDYLDLAPERQAAVPASGRVQDAGIQFEDVTFSYRTKHPALEAVSFKVNDGQIAAFVGPSGAGKSTLAALIARFYDAGSGRVLVGGHDVRDFDLGTLRSQIGIVTQDTYLFHDSIRNNIRYAKREASDDEIYAAAAAANIHTAIRNFPDGYDTVVGERGLQLSGGERQRIALARMFLKNPKILILDEATSALDAQTEAAIQTSLETVMRGRTCLVIAHRLSTIAHADVIFVLDRGRIVESGSHEALLQRAGLYASMFEMQRIASSGSSVPDLPPKTPNLVVPNLIATTE